MSPAHLTHAFHSRKHDSLRTQIVGLILILIPVFFGVLSQLFGWVAVAQGTIWGSRRVEVALENIGEFLASRNLSFGAPFHNFA